MVASVVDGVFDVFKKKVTDLENENDQLRSRVEALEHQADKSEQYSRRNCLRLSGVPETGTESADDKVMEIASAIDAGLVIGEIDCAHRVGKPKEPQLHGHSRPRDIIIKFCSYRSRQKLMKNKSKLKGSGYSRSFINEDLTSIRNKIFYHARQLLKDKHVTGVWTADGVILVKDKTLKIHRIENQTQFDRFKCDLQL